MQRGLDLISKFCEMTLKFFKSKTQTNPSGRAHAETLERSGGNGSGLFGNEALSFAEQRGGIPPQCLSLESCDQVEDLRLWLGYKSGGNKRASSLQSERSAAPVGLNYGLLWHPEVDP